jgi:hypothetical protein
MDTIQDQIRELQTSVRRQRFAIVALGTILVGTALIGAVRRTSDATFDTITCKAWNVADEDGKVRITAGTGASGEAGVWWADTDGKVRITAGTAAGGRAAVGWADTDGKVRITAGTAANGRAMVGWADTNGKPRITAETRADGTVVYPTKDGK